MKTTTALLVALATLAISADAPAKPKRPLGDSNVIATVPAPGFPGGLGFPEGLAVNGNTAYVGTSATFGTVGSAASVIYGYNKKTGALTRTITITGQDLSAEHGLSNLAFDAQDRLYALETQQGVLRMDIHGNGQEVYAPIPDLPTCSAAPLGAACSPTAFDRPPLPNDLVFDDAGYLYVTDSFQATIWRIPPGGGAPVVWFQDPSLDNVFGPNGIRLSPDHTTLYFVSTTTGFSFGTPGYILTLPLVDQPTIADLGVFHVYGYEAPDGIAFGASGELYVALALSNEISVLRPDGSESARFAGPAQDSCGQVPWDAPASIAFDNASKSLLVTNHALFTGITQNFVLFDVYVRDVAEPLVRPMLP